MDFAPLAARIAGLRPVRGIGRVVATLGGRLEVAGLSRRAALGDRVRVMLCPRESLAGEIVALTPERVSVLLEGHPVGIAVGDKVEHLGPAEISPDDSWIGRIIDSFGAPLDGRPLFSGRVHRTLRAAPPPAAARRALGERLDTGVAVFNTLLPIVRGQRVGLFAGSGVGKSTLLGKLGRRLVADVVVIALVGERGRELREFVDNVLGPEGMRRAVIVLATSDQSPLVRRRCAWAAMAVAEHFRDAGAHVLLLADSITRFAEAHREVALAAGEVGSLRGFPPSTSHLIMSLAERAGPGAGAAGDITAVFTVLVAGSDMDEPIADILRGVLDGHVVLDREIAERGRYPAVNLLRSVSRSLPRAASRVENETITLARRQLGTYERAELMIQSGLYVAGSDAAIDSAIAVYPALDAFLAEDEPGDVADSFRRLAACLGIDTAQSAAPADEEERFEALDLPRGRVAASGEFAPKSPDQTGRKPALAPFASAQEREDDRAAGGAAVEE